MTSILPRVSSAVSPRIVWRSIAAAAITVTAAPILIIVVLLVFGLIVGTDLASTELGAVGWAGSVGAILAVLAIFHLTVGTLAVARVHAGESVGRALLGAIRAFPRLVAAVTVIALAIALTLFLWPVFVIGALILAIMLRLRRRAGVRRALLAAIPFAPLAFCLALVPAAVAAGADSPASIRSLLATALGSVRRRTRAVLVFAVVAALSSALLSWIGSAASQSLDLAGQGDLSLLVVGACLALLMVALGTALAIALPLQSSPPRARTRQSWSPFTRRVAALVITSIVAALLPIVVTTTPASADPVLITPTVYFGFDGGGPSPLLSADVAVPVEGGAPAGSVQFFDGTTAVGAPVRLTPSTYDSTLGTSYLLDRPVLDPGQHSFTAVFTPDGPLVATAASEAFNWHLSAATTIAITVDAAAAVGSPATVTVALSANYPTPVKPTGTVVIDWEGGSVEAPIVDGVASTTIAELLSPGIGATYAGSNDFSEASASIAVGEVALPDATEITATILNAPHALGDVLVATAAVNSPTAAPGTVVTGTVQVFAGDTLLVATPLGDPLSIPTTGLTAGPATLRFAFVPAGSFIASETTVDVTLAKATTVVNATLTGGAYPAWGAPRALDVTATSSHSVQRTVEVRDTTTNTVVATTAVDIAAGTGTVSIDLSTVLRPASHTLVATVLGDVDHVAATSPPLAANTASALTTTTLVINPNPVEIGQPATLTATVVSTAGLPDALPGRITFLLPDGSQRPVPVVDGVASTIWTPSTPETRTVSASYFDTSFQFAGSGVAATMTASAAVAPMPSAEWTGSLTPADRSVTLTYSAAPGRDLPSGGVRILDADGEIISAGLLADGVVTLRVEGTPGARPVLTAAYLGDGVYGARSDPIPVESLTNYLPSLSLVAPDSTDLGVPFAVDVSVSGVPTDLIKSISLSGTGAAGATTDLGTLTLGVFGTGTSKVTLLTAGVHSIVATVTFTASSGLDAASSTPSQVAVAPVPVPVLTITSPTTLPIAAGSPLDLDVTAAFIADGSTGVPAGTTASVLDGSGAILGTVTLLGAAGVDGYRGRLHLASVSGGALRVHAAVAYGPLVATASSAELAITVNPPATALYISPGSATVGGPVDITVTAIPEGTLPGPTQSVEATVTVDGVDYPLALTRTGTTGYFRGVLPYTTVRAGDLAITASIVGDGADTGPATASAAAWVARRATSVAVQVVSSGAAGEDVVVSARVIQLGEVTSPAYDGALTISGFYGSCVTGANFACTIPGSQVGSGVNNYYASFAGDSNNEPSYGSASFTAGTRASSLTVSFSPAIDSWVYGDPITATWTTTSGGSPAPGRVELSIAGSYCSDTAATGSCTVTPRSLITSGEVTADYRVAYGPSDSIAGAVVSGTSKAYLCLYPRFEGTADYSAAVRCGPNNFGLRSGSVVTLAGSPTADYTIDHWTVDGATIVGSGANATVSIASSSSYRFVERYAPKCFTLTIAPAQAQRLAAGGYGVTSSTPNCSHPSSPSPDDMAEVLAGKPRFRAGTEVYVILYPNKAAQGLAIDTVTGMTMRNDSVGSLVLDADRTVTATFKVAACTPTSVGKPVGGTVAITSAARPASSATLLPATGACTARNGQPGYVPGTTLSLSAVAAKDGFFSDWSVDSGILALGSKPANAVASATREVVVPDNSGLQLGARFSTVSCVSVTLVSRTIVASFEGTLPRGPHGATLDYWGTEAGCGGIATTRTVALSGSGNYRIVTQRYSLIAGGTAQAVTDQPYYYPLESGHGSTAFVTWSGGSTGSRASNQGPYASLTPSAAPKTIYADWVLEGSAWCSAEKVELPQGGSYTLAPTYANEPFCENPELIGKFQTKTYRAAKAASAPGLTPIMTNLATGTFSQSTGTISGAGSYALEYCAPLGIELYLHDDSGTATRATATQLAALIDDDGGCPNGWTRPSRSTKTALSTTGQTSWTVIGGTGAQGPVRVVDAAGTVTGPARIDLQAICFTLDLYDATIETKSTCAGGAANRFTRGTVVQFVANEADRFDGWEDVDAEQGQTAYVIMDKNRRAGADLHNYSIWEKAGNALSSVAQRVVGAIVTAATGIMLAEVFLVKAAGWALKGAAAGLRAAGVNGAAVEGIDKAGSIVQAQFDALSLLATCATSSASGPSAALTITQGGSTTPTGGSVDEIMAAGKAQLAAQLAKSGIKADIPLGSILGDAGMLTNAFGGNLSGYTADAKSSWSNYASNMASCTQKGLDNYVNTTYK